jgi:hypothetical protein
MLMTTVVAVALGLTPVKDESLHRISGDYSKAVGQYSQTVNRNGSIRLKGYSPAARADYDVIVHKNGDVEGAVGAWAVTFHVSEDES